MAVKLANDGSEVAPIEAGAPIMRKTSAPPTILHVDDDVDVLRLLADTIDDSVDLVSVESVGEARQAIREKRFDMIVLDLLLGPDSGLGLLPDLYDVDDRQIPVIVFSARCADLTYHDFCTTSPLGGQWISHGQIKIILDKSRTPIDALLASVLDWLAIPTWRAIAGTA